MYVPHQTQSGTFLITESGLWQRDENMSGSHKEQNLGTEKKDFRRKRMLLQPLKWDEFSEKVKKMTIYKQQKAWRELYITIKFVMQITDYKTENLTLNWYGFELERNIILGS